VPCGPSRHTSPRRSYAEVVYAHETTPWAAAVTLVVLVVLVVAFVRAFLRRRR
jgi:hypothetical protein